MPALRGSDATWTVELLQDLPPQERPAPFMNIEHSFASLDEARTWLGAPRSCLRT
jgi:hypothetical protein